RAVRMNAVPFRYIIGDIEVHGAAAVCFIGIVCKQIVGKPKRLERLTVKRLRNAAPALKFHREQSKRLPQGNNLRAYGETCDNAGPYQEDGTGQKRRTWQRP